MDKKGFQSILVEKTREKADTAAVAELFYEWSEKLQNLSGTTPAGTLNASDFGLRNGFEWDVESSHFSECIDVLLKGKADREEPFREALLTMPEAVLLEALQQELGGTLATRVDEDECGCTRTYTVLVLHRAQRGDIIAVCGQPTTSRCCRHD